MDREGDANTEMRDLTSSLVYADNLQDVKEFRGENPTNANNFTSENTLSTNEFLEKANLGLDFIDHFSLRGPSSTVRFRGARIMVYDQSNDQLLLEDCTENDGSHTVTVKRMRNGTFGLRMLRMGYTLVATLMAGFLFVFCFQIILFLFLNLPVSGGATSFDFDFSQLLGTILSLPLFLHAMGSLMALGTAFVTDTWNGHPLFRAMMDLPLVIVEWICFIVFVGIPALTIFITLISGKENWWETTAATWMVCVFLFFVVFCLAVIYRELVICFDLVQIHDLEMKTKDRNSEIGKSKLAQYWHLAKRAILLTRKQLYSGNREERYLVRGKENLAGGYALSDEHVPVKTRKSLYCRMTELTFLNNIFEEVNPPVRKYGIEEIRDILPFVTRYNWSLERMYCRNRNSRMIAAVWGPSALLPNQVKSSLFCMILGLVLSAGIVMGALIWIDSPATAVVFVGIVIAGCCVLPAVTSAINTYKMYAEEQDKIASSSTEDEACKEIFIDDTKGPDGNNNSTTTTAVYQVWETVTISRPRQWYCWARFWVQFGFLFLWPLITLYSIGDIALGTVFFVLGFASYLRINFDASAILSDLGSINDVDVSLENVSKEGKGNWLTSMIERVGVKGRLVDSKQQRILLTKARISEVVGKISRSRTAGRWVWVYGVFAFISLFMLLAAGDEETTPQGDRPPIVQLKDFHYPPQPDLPYPSCDMSKGFTIPGYGSSSLGDYAFLAALSYETPNTTQHHLDNWFGNGTVIDEDEFVTHYRNETDTSSNPVYYKLLSIPSVPGYGIITIRGSQTTWDFLHDAQLWSAAFLAQVVRAFIPFGWIWTPILDDLVTAINFIENKNLKRVSYYRLTTDFVNALLEDEYEYNNRTFDTLRVTGASLGGGLAIITGAQTRANAVAISGLNGVLSRNTFTPKVTKEELNEKVFNVIPDRDIIANTGGRSRLFQEIECRADMNNLLGCHSMWRSVCELSYTCGSGSRPVLCRCVEMFGYEKPLPKDPNQNRTFEQACKEEEEKLIKEGYT